MRPRPRARRNDRLEKQQAVRTISNLPGEILLKIFLFFSPQQLCSLLAYVCSRWHEVTRDTLLWRNLTLEQSSLVSAKTLFPSAPLQQLRVLTVNEWEGAGDALIELVASHCPSLTKFVHSGSSISISSKALLDLATSCPNVTELFLGQASLPDKNYDVFQSFTNLCGLELTLEIERTDNDFSQCDSTGLSWLNITIDGHQASPQFNEQLCRFVKKHQAVLNVLYVVRGGDRLQNDFYMAAVPTCANLTGLTLYAAHSLTDAALGAIADGCKRLRLLSISAAGGITGAGVVAALTPAGRMTELTYLRFSECAAVDDQAVIAIANRFSEQLKVFGCSYAPVVSSRSIARVLAKCSGLEELYLDGVTRLSKACLLKVPKRVPKLKTLSIQHSQIAGEVVTELRNAMPNLTVLSSTSCSVS